MAEPAFGQRFLIVLGAACVEHIGNQDGVLDWRHVDAVLRQHHRIEFQIVADLENARIREQRLEHRQRVCGLDLVRREAAREQARAVAGLGMRERDITGFIDTG